MSLEKTVESKTKRQKVRFPSLYLRRKTNKIHCSSEFHIMLLNWQMNSSEQSAGQAGVISANGKEPLNSKLVEGSALQCCEIRVVGSMD